MDGESFFSRKRPWSKIKDAILGSYMPAYFAKLSRVPDSRFLIIDAFAGPGKFEDGQPGSPLIICKAAEHRAKGRYEAVFINLDEDHHQKLSSILKHAGYRNARAILGDSRDILKQLHTRLDEPLIVFLYMDPFGLKDVSFDLIRPFIERNHRYSTEILINLQAPIMHRLAARNAFSEEPASEKVKVFHRTLSQVLGGDYWKKWMLSGNLTPREREEKVVEDYCRMLSSTDYLQYTGWCPIQESREGHAKYYMIFASRHIDAMTLLNDEMIKAFQKYLIDRELGDTLFADMSWQDWRDLKEIKKLALDYIGKYPGQTRKQLWNLIVQKHFLRFTHSEYTKALNEFVREGVIFSPTPRKQYRLNDQCELYLINDG